jgi:ABC-type sulfate/molybdate transport systems ATPase subunit
MTGPGIAKAAVMLDFALDARRGNFHLQVECALSQPWTVVFGPSGAGKTTLLRLLAGLERPKHGRIVLDSEMLTESGRGVWLKPGRHRIAMVAQQPALFPHLSVDANIAYGLRGLIPPERKLRVETLLDLTGASSLASRRPRDLSGGEAQRIALARALATGPKLLLLDEPFSALDGAASDELLARLQTWLRERNIQTILATHDVSDALATGAEVLLLRQGRLAAQGPAAEVLASERKRLLDRLHLD